MGGRGEIPVALAASLLGQWFLVQLPLWGLALGYRLRLAHGTLTTGNGQPPPLQFGIRQLMTLTAIVGVLLGLSRALIVILASRAGNFTHGEAFIFMYLATVAVIMTLPLVMAALLPRLPIIASLIVVALIGIATAWELPLFGMLPGVPSGPGGPDFWHFVFMNAFTAAWILAIIAILRRNGYGLVAQFR
jgi:hypothetical protein